MPDIPLKLLAFAALVVFLGVLLWHVPRLDLGAVVGATVLLVAWDFFAPRRQR